MAVAEDGQLHEGTMNVHLEGTMDGRHREGMMDGRHREGTMDVHPREETTDDHPREGMKLLALVAETNLRPIPEGDRTTIVLLVLLPKATVVVVLRTIIEKTIMIGETEIVVATIVQSVMTTEMETATIVQSATNNAMVVAMIGDTPILGGMQKNPSAGTTQGLVVETLVQTMDQIEVDERRGQSPIQKNREEMSGGEMSHEGKIVTTRTIEADEKASVIEEVATRTRRVTVYVEAMSLRS